MSSIITPIGTRVAIKPNEEPGVKKKGEIYVPQNAKRVERYGTVQAAGPNTEQCKAGHRVCYKVNMGTYIEDLDLTIMQENQVEFIL